MAYGQIQFTLEVIFHKAAVMTIKLFLTYLEMFNTGKFTKAVEIF